MKARAPYILVVLAIGVLLLSLGVVSKKKSFSDENNAVQKKKSGISEIKVPKKTY